MTAEQAINYLANQAAKVTPIAEQATFNAAIEALKQLLKKEEDANKSTESDNEASDK